MGATKRPRPNFAQLYIFRATRFIWSLQVVAGSDTDQSVENLACNPQPVTAE